MHSSSHCHAGCQSAHAHFYGHHHGHSHSLLASMVQLQFAAAGAVVRPLVRCMETVTSHLLPACGTGAVCAVPQACWMPLSAGQVCTRVQPEADSTIRLLVINDDYRPHNYVLSAAGDNAPLVSFSSTTLTLGPKERAVVEVQFAAPALAHACCPEYHQVLLWVKGCRDHYLNWQVKVSPCRKWLEQALSVLPLSLPSLPASCCVPAVPIHDRPAYTLHWYDHFYCQRDCG